MPVPWEPTTSYARGDRPRARRPSSTRAARSISSTSQTGRPYEAGIAMLDVDPDIAAWNAEACAAAEPVIAAGGDVGGDPALGRRAWRA